MAVEPLLTPVELREHLDRKFTVKTFANWRSLGQGPRFRRIGNKILYPLSEIQKWEAQTVFSGTADYHAIPGSA